MMIAFPTHAHGSHKSSHHFQHKSTHFRVRNESGCESFIIGIVVKGVIIQLITEANVRYFYVGGYGGFDRLAAVAVKRAKQKYPDITLMLVLPYHPAERPTETPDGFDGTYYPDGLENTPRRYTIVRTNRIMVDSCDWLVCYVRHSASNSRNLLDYAERRKEKGLIQIVNIGKSEVEPG